MSNSFEIREIDGKKYSVVPPNAGRMVRGMGRLSYDFEQSIADLVDNSIAARATKVDILIEQRIGGKVYVHVADNGIGIRADDLSSAIQYGAADREDDSSLGIYGFGLKTACQSFTSTFSVVSKVKGESETNMIVFDENVINQYNDFIFLLDVALPKFKKTLSDISNDESGTLIVTENADRLLTSENAKDDKKMENYLSGKGKGKIYKTEQHLRRTFQRFLDHEDTRAQNVDIYVNDAKISPWDPFCLKGGNFLESEWLSPALRTISGKEGHIVMRGYIIPSKVEFEDQELYEDAEIGPNTHGVYVYRENRLITGATYFELFRRDTHMANLRVEFSYEGSLDELFHTALQKGSIVLGDLEDAVRDFLTPLIRETNNRSRGNAKRKDTRDLHGLSQKRIAAVESRVPHADVEAIDSKTARVVSKYGEVVLPIPSINDDSEALAINPVESIDDGHLWAMRLQNGKQVVELNKGHDFYTKVYLPNKDYPIAMQGLDIVLWSLAITEANCTIPEYKRQFREFRFEVSRALRELVESLPEPKYEDYAD